MRLEQQPLPKYDTKEPIPLPPPTFSTTPVEDNEPMLREFSDSVACANTCSLDEVPPSPSDNATLSAFGCTRNKSNERIFHIQYIYDNQRIDRDMDMEETGSTKPSRDDKLITARILAFALKDIEAARWAQASIDQRQVTRRFVRQRASARRAGIRAEGCHHDRTPDSASC